VFWLREFGDRASDRLLCRIEYVLPNLVVGTITRESVNTAFSNGINADQVRRHGFPINETTLGSPILRICCIRMSFTAWKPSSPLQIAATYLLKTLKLLRSLENVGFS
jgi:hypothetical protein